MRKVLVILVCLILLGCKKEKDRNPPVISISSPVVFSNHNVFDFVNVLAEVSDESNLVAITIDIQDANFINVIPKISINVTSNNMDVAKNIYLDDIHLESGIHYVKVWASDGTNEKSEFKQISITAVPLSINNMFIVSSTGSGPQVWSAFDGVSTTPFYSFNSEYGGAAVNSYHQYLLTMGAENDHLVAYHPGIIDTVWDKVNLGNPPQPYFKSLQEGPEGIVYITTTTGEVRGYGQSGTIAASVNAPVDYVPDDLFVWGDKLLVEQRHNVTASHFMGIYYRNSGALDQTIGFGNDIVSWEVRTADELFVFSNDAGGQGKMEIYSYAGNSFWEPHAIPSGSILATFGVHPDQIIIAHDLGLYTYTYSTNSLIQIESGHAFTQLKYDQVNNVLRCIEGSDLYTYDLAGNQLGYFSHSDDIKEILILYNR
ncbi:MAG: hypothetical protein JKY54_13260 [Flavobacteriales bacterium]|nr:hypothetical protein [Flavobacteriales bacterium]